MLAKEQNRLIHLVSHSRLSVSHWLGEVQLSSGSSGGNIGELAADRTGERLGCAGSKDLRAPRYSEG